MAKKSENPPSNEGSNSSSIFKILFGELPEQNYASALFSEANPFRRKPKETRNPNRGIEFSAEDSENEATVAHAASAAAAEPKKRKKEKVHNGSSSLDDEKVGEAGKKLKVTELNKNLKNDYRVSEFEAKEDIAEGNKYLGGNSGSGDVGGKNLKNKKKKRKRDELEAEYEARQYGVHDDKEIKEERNPVVGEKRKKMINPEEMMVSKEGFDDESKLLRTVFVGNLPLKIKKKELLKEFGKFGEVESVRIRSVPLADGKTPRKGAIIKKKINENGNSVHAYIVFKTEECAQAALGYNMAVLGGNHIRVDRACPPRKKLKGDASPLYDNKRTVFVGNLPFDVKDEEIYQLFSGIKNLESSVEAVRVVRDPGSSLGKGIAYVLFKTMDAAKLIVTKRNIKLRNRELRLSHARSDSTPSKRKVASAESNGHSAKKFFVDSQTPDTATKVKVKSNLYYQGLRASKSGDQKKVHKRINNSEKPRSQIVTEQNSVKKKRPAVAARKEKAREALSGPKLLGTKRKLWTPDNASQKKKARKFR